MQSMVVSQLMNRDKSWWDVGLLKNLFEEDIVQAILKIPQWKIHQSDSWVWVKTPSGELSVKSAFKKISKNTHASLAIPVLGRIWKTRLHERQKLLLWRVAAGLLPTKDTLVKFVVSLNPTCVLCEKMDESIVHLLWNCDLARAIWLEVHGLFVLTVFQLIILPKLWKILYLLLHSFRLMGIFVKSSYSKGLLSSISYGSIGTLEFMRGSRCVQKNF